MTSHGQNSSSCCSIRRRHITMGPLGRNRRVRARTSKRRTPGQWQQSIYNDCSFFQSPKFARAREAQGQLTRKVQRSPERKRSRAPVFGRTALKSRFSLAELLVASPYKVARAKRRWLPSLRTSTCRKLQVQRFWAMEAGRARSFLPMAMQVSKDCCSDAP